MQDALRHEEEEEKEEEREKETNGLLKKGTFLTRSVETICRRRRRIILSLSVFLDHLPFWILAIVRSICIEDDDADHIMIRESTDQGRKGPSWQLEQDNRTAVAS